MACVLSLVSTGISSESAISRRARSIRRPTMASSLRSCMGYVRQFRDPQSVIIRDPQSDFRNSSISLIPNVTFAQPKEMGNLVNHGAAHLLAQGSRSAKGARQRSVVDDDPVGEEHSRIVTALVERHSL